MRIEVVSLIEGLNDALREIEKTIEHSQQSTNEINHFVAYTRDSFKGLAADNVRNYLQEGIQPVFQCRQEKMLDLKKIFQEMRNEAEELFGGNGIVESDYLEQDYFQNVSDYYEELIDIMEDANQASRVNDDLIVLTPLQVDEIYELKYRQQKHLQQVAQKVYAFDTKYLGKLESLLQELEELDNTVLQLSGTSHNLGNYQSGTIQLLSTNEKMPDGCDGFIEYNGEKYYYMLFNDRKFFINKKVPPFLKSDYEDYFPYDHNVKANPGDFIQWNKWGLLLTGGQIKGHLPDGIKMYQHYRGNSGKDKHIDYGKAYKEDVAVRSFINMVNTENELAALEYYRRTGITDFTITSEYYQSNQYGGYPKTENWQKAIGDHRAYGTTSIQIQSNQKIQTVTKIYESDKYDFNAGQSDIASGASDNENGRFATLGWAKPFYTYGSLELTSDYDKDYNRLSSTEIHTDNNESSEDRSDRGRKREGRRR